MLVRPLGQWRLRAAGGFTGRANSALAVGEPGVPIPAALAEVRGFAAQHELTPMVATALDTPWQRAVLGQGWLPHHEHPAGPRSAVLVTPLGRLAEQSTPGEVQLSIDDDPHPAWWELAGQRPITDAQRHVLGAPGLPQVGFGLARVAGTPVGAVRAVVLDEHLYAARLVVSAQHRRRGLGVALMAASARWAQQRGAGWCVLQVAERNAAALAFYRSLGFTVHHRYEYLRPPAMTR
jgi:ribosomal protein S18 acetylase RimI-like enzyme